MSTAALDIIVSAKGGAEVQRTVEGIHGSFVELSAKVYVAIEALNKVWETAKHGAEFTETMARLNRQMQDFNSTAQRMVAGLQATSQGILSIQNAATMASRALSVGLDPEQTQTFTKAAMLLKEVMGIELPQAFDDLVNAIITGRGKILGNIGIFVDLDKAAQRLAVSTGRTTEQITKQERVMLAANAIAGQVKAAHHRLADGMLSDADRLRQVETRWKDLWLSVGISAKTGVITSLEWIEKLGKGITDLDAKDRVFNLDRLKSIFSALAEAAVTAFSGDATTYLNKPKEALELLQNTFNNPQDDKVWQGVLGRAIVSDAQGRMKQKVVKRGEPLVPTPSDVLMSRLRAEFEPQEKLLDASLERAKAFYEAKAALYDADVLLQKETAEDVVSIKANLLLGELEYERDVLRQKEDVEVQFSARAKKIDFTTIQEKEAEATRHAAKVAELATANLALDQKYGLQAQKNQAERDQARNVAEAARGERVSQQLTSRFGISEAERQKDFDGQQAYYQGLADLGRAGLASDADQARTERALLREQLAFKLRLTAEETDRVLFLRKAGRTEDAVDVASHGATGLSRKNVEGIVTTATATDILAAERANDDFFSGWVRGMADYTNSRNSAFSMSVDMAKVTALAMQQGFQTFFFDMFEGRINSMKDILKGLLDFTKRIIAQIVAQLVTTGLIKAGIAAFSGSIMPPASNQAGSDVIGLNTGQFQPKIGMASGGSFTVGGHGGTDSRQIGFMATPGERVTVETPSQQRGGNQINIAVNVNGTGGKDTSGTSGSASPNFTQLARDLSKLVESKLIEEQRPGGLLAAGAR